MLAEKSGSVCPGLEPTAVPMSTEKLLLCAGTHWVLSRGGKESQHLRFYTHSWFGRQMGETKARVDRQVRVPPGLVRV